MKKQLSPAERVWCYQQHQAEQTYLEIAAEIDRSVECVRYWCRKLKKGESAHTVYLRTSPGLLTRFDARVRYVILRLKLAHKRWGPNRILYHLQKRPSLTGLKLPSEAQIGRYLHQWKRFRQAPKPIQAKARPQPPDHVNQRWQVDFKTGIPLKNGTLVNLHTVVDPYARTVMGAYLYPAGKVGHAPLGIHAPEVQQTLRHCFANWHTLPEEIQTDHEKCIAAQRRYNDFPTHFTLWLVGLGIQHRFIRPGKPTDNAEVERQHRTLSDYTLVGNEHLDRLQLQAVIDDAVYELNYELPSRAKGCGGSPPIQVHPELLDPDRLFFPELEQAFFDLDRVDDHLATLSWTRTVSKVGVVELGTQRYSLGRKYTRQEVLIRFDPADRHFVFYYPNNPEVELRRCLAKGLDTDRFLGAPQFLSAQQLAFPWFLSSTRGNFIRSINR
jgi:transposase InsO family protein